MEDNFARKSLMVLFSAAMVNFISGILYIWSLISKSLINDLNWTSKQASLPYTISTISFVIAMIIAGRVLDEKGPRYPSMVGSLLMGLGIVFSGFASNPILMSLSMGLLAGAGIGIINVSTTASILKWFPSKKRGMATGIVVAGGAIASSFYYPIADYLINNLGISKTFIYMGIPALIISVFLSWFLDNPPKELTILINREEELLLEDRMDLDLSWREMLRTNEFYKLWFILAFSSSGGLMIIGHISTIAKVQVAWEAGFLLVILMSIFNTIGRIFGGIISDRFDKIVVLRWIFIIQGINLLLFSLYKDVFLLGLGAGIVGLCYGAGFAIFPPIISEGYGIKNFGTNYAIIFTAWGFGGIIGPMTGAAILDATESYNYSYTTSFLLFLISVLITFTFKRDKLDNVKG